MDQIQNRRIAAVKAADAINAIEGVPVSDYAKTPVSYTHLRAHETGRNLVCRLLLEKKQISEPKRQAKNS